MATPYRSPRSRRSCGCSSFSSRTPSSVAAAQPSRRTYRISSSSCLRLSPSEAHSSTQQGYTAHCNALPHTATPPPSEPVSQPFPWPPASAAVCSALLCSLASSHLLTPSPHHPPSPQSPFPDAKKEGCACACALADATTKIDTHCAALVSGLAPALAHQHSRVRSGATEALFALLLHEPSLLAEVRFGSRQNYGSCLRRLLCAFANLLCLPDASRLIPRPFRSHLSSRSSQWTERPRCGSRQSTHSLSSFPSCRRVVNTHLACCHCCSQRCLMR